MSEPSQDPADTVKVACLQLHPRVGDKDANVAASLAWIERAAAQGARLIVLPELANSGYVFSTREEAFALAEAVPAGPTCQAWMAAAARLGVPAADCLAVEDSRTGVSAALAAGMMTVMVPDLAPPDAAGD